MIILYDEVEFWYQELWIVFVVCVHRPTQFFYFELYIELSRKRDFFSCSFFLMSVNIFLDGSVVDYPFKNKRNKLFDILEAC